MDKEKLTSYIKDYDLKTIIIKNLSKAEGVLYHHDIRHTDFMNPFERKNFVGILKSTNSISFRQCTLGSFPERIIIQMYPDYMDETQIENPYEVIRTTGNFKFNKIEHRDYLGALLSLGIKREKLGDIHVHEDCAYIIADKTISNYIEFNLTSIAKGSVACKIVDEEDFEESVPEYQEKIINIASNRADVIVSEIFNISRSKTQEFIEKGRLYVNFELFPANSREIKNGSLISLKGYGRAYFDEIISETKKGRLRAKVKKVL